MPDFNFLDTGIWGDAYRDAGGIVVPEYLQQLRERQDSYGWTEPPAPEPMAEPSYMPPEQFVDWPTYQRIVETKLKPHEAYDEYVGVALPQQLKDMGYSPEEIQQALQQFPSMVQRPAPDYGVFGNLWEAAKTGVKSGNRGIAASGYDVAGEVDDVARLAVESALDQPTAPRVAFDQARRTGNDSLWESAKGFLGAIVDQPRGFTEESVYQIAQSYPVIASGLAAFFTPVPGAGPAAAGASSFALDTGATLLGDIVDMAHQRGVDINNAAAVERMLREPGVYQQLRESAAAHGFGVAATDAAFAAISFGIGKAAAGLTRAGRPLRAGGLVATLPVVGMVGEGVGEFAGSQLAGKPYSPDDIIAEAMSGIGSEIAFGAGGYLKNRSLQTSVPSQPAAVPGAPSLEELLGINNTEPVSQGPIPTLTGGVLANPNPTLAVGPEGGAFVPTPENITARDRALRGQMGVEELPVIEEITIGDIPNEPPPGGGGVGVTELPAEEITLRPAQVVDSAELRIREGRLLPQLPPGRANPPLIGGAGGVATQQQLDDARIEWLTTPQSPDLRITDRDIATRQQSLVDWLAFRGITPRTNEQVDIISTIANVPADRRQEAIAAAVEELAASPVANAEQFAQGLLAMSRLIPKDLQTRARAQAALESALPGVPLNLVPNVVASEVAQKVMADLEAGVTRAPTPTTTTTATESIAALPARGPLPDTPVQARRGLKRGEPIPIAGRLGGLVSQLVGSGPAGSNEAPVQQSRGGLRARVDQEGTGGGGRRGSLRGGKAAAVGRDTRSTGAQPVDTTGASGVSGVAPPIKVQLSTTPVERRYGTQAEDVANKETLQQQREDAKAKKATGGLGKKAKEKLTKQKYSDTYPGRDLDKDVDELFDASDDSSEAVRARDKVISALYDTGGRDAAANNVIDMLDNNESGARTASAEQLIAWYKGGGGKKTLFDVDASDDMLDVSTSDATRYLGPMSGAAINAMGTFDSAMQYIGAQATNPLARIVADRIRSMDLQVPIVGESRMQGMGNAGFRPADNRILYDIDRASLKNILHESVHAATLAAMHNPQTPAEWAAAKYINQLYLYAKQQIRDHHYGLSSKEEFVAEAFSNPGFQAALAKIPLPGKSRYSVWDAFKAAIMRLLGVTKSDTLLSETLLAGTELFSGRQEGARGYSYADQSSARSIAAPSSAILGTKDGARTFIAYAKDENDPNTRYTLYATTPQNLRGDPATKITGLTREQAEQYMRKAGSEPIAPASDTTVKSGNPKNTSTQLVGYGTNGALQGIAFEQKNGTWTYYESDADVRTDPTTRISAGLSKDAAQRAIVGRGFTPEPPVAGAVRSNSATPTSVGYKPANDFEYTVADVRAGIKAIGTAQEKAGHRPSENVGIVANLRNSNAERELMQAKERYVKPVAKAGRDIIKRFGKTQEEIEQTLVDLHTVERMKKKIDQTLRGKDDAATQAKRINGYQAKMDAAQQRLNAQTSSNPAYVQAIRQDFAPKWKAMTDNNTDLAAKYGRITVQVAQQIKNAYDYYVPLQTGEKTTTGKYATGANTETDQSFRRVVEQLERIVNWGEDNRVVKSVGDLIRNHDVINDNNGQPVGTVGKGVAVRYDEATNSLSEEVDSHTFDPNTEFFYENGERVPITISNDPVLLNALNPYKGQKRTAVVLAIIATSAWLNRLAAIGKTSLHPAFMVGNIQRDIQAAVMNAPSGVSRARFAAYLADPRTISEVTWNVTRELAGARPTGLYANARHDGAFISHRDYVGLAPLAHDIDTYFKPSQSWKGRNALRKHTQSKAFEALSLASQISESIPRFAMYKAAYDSYMSGKPDTPQNRSDARLFAANAAKTASVNFEQRGAANLSSYWMFGNAKVQGLNALVKTAKRAPVKVALGLAGITALGYFIGSAQQDGEKDRDGKPKSVKMSDQVKDAKVFLNPGGFAITLNQEISPFYVFGHALSEYNRGNTSGAHTASRIATSVVNNAWPGNVPQSEIAGYKSNPWLFAVQALTPSPILPFEQVGFNENAFGSEIVPGMNAKLARGIAKSDMGSPNENQLAVNTAKWLYNATGGAIDVAPQQLKYIHNYFNPLTETYAFMRDLAGLRESKYEGDVVNPIMRKLTANVTPFYDQQQFDELLAKAKRAEMRAKGTQDVPGIGIDNLSPEEQALARSSSTLSKINSDIKSMFKGSQMMNKAQRDALTERARERMLEGIRRYNELRDRTVPQR